MAERRAEARWSTPCLPTAAVSRLLPSLVVCLLCAGPVPAASADLYRGSSLTLRNAVSAVSFDRSAQLSYDPFYALTLGADLRLRPVERAYLRARFDLSRELTRSSWTTRSGETIPGDLLVGGGSDRLLTVPTLELELSAELLVRLPVSPVSRAQTLNVGLEPTLRLSRRFALRQGAVVRYGFSPSVYSHRFTTAEAQAPLIAGCSASAPECQRYLNLGTRNVAWSHAHVVDASLAITSWLSVSAAAGLQEQRLYPSSSDVSVSHTPVAPTDAQHSQLFAFEATLSWVRPLTVGVGVATASPQLAPDSSRYPLFANRHTQLFLDLRLSPSGLVEALTEGGSP